MVGWFYGMLLLMSAKCPRPLGRRENSLWKTIRRTIQRTNNSLRCNGWISSKVLPGIFLGYVFDRGENLDRRYSDCGLGRFGEYGRVGNLYSKNLRERSIYSTKRRWIHIPRSRWFSKIVRKRLRFPRIHSKANQVCLNLQNLQMTLKPGLTSGLRKVTSSIVITMNLEFNSMCRKKKHSLFNWNTLTQQDLVTQILMCCKKAVLTTTGTWMWIDACQVLGQESQSSHRWERNLQKDICGPGGDWRKFKQLPDLRMCGLKYGPKLEKPLKREAKQEWAIEKPKLDNARQLRGICFVDPEDGESLKFQLQKKRTKKHLGLQETEARSDESNMIPKTKHACVEARESTRRRLEPSLPKNHEDHVAGKGYNSIIHINLVHKFIPMHQAMKIVDAKAAVDKEWKKLATIPAWDLDKVKSKKEVILKAQRGKNNVHFSTLMDICHLKKCGVGAQITKIQKRQSRAPRGHCKRRLWSLCFFDWTGLVCVPNDRCKKKWMSLLDYQTVNWQAADARSAYNQLKMEDAPRLLKIPKSQCPDIWIRLPRHPWPKSWANIEDPVVLFDGHLYGHPLAGL